MFIFEPITARGMEVLWFIPACPDPDAEKDVLGKCYCMKEDERISQIQSSLEMSI